MQIPGIRNQLFHWTKGVVTSPRVRSALLLVLFKHHARIGQWFECYQPIRMSPFNPAFGAEARPLLPGPGSPRSAGVVCSPQLPAGYGPTKCSYRHFYREKKKKNQLVKCFAILFFFYEKARTCVLHGIVCILNSH